MTQDIESLTIADLDEVRTIIATATERAAFRVNELSRVGAVYDKLSRFLDSVAHQFAESTETLTESADSQGE